MLLNTISKTIAGLGVIILLTSATSLQPTEERQAQNKLPQNTDKF